MFLNRVPNFDEPIDALEICHENIVKRMNTVEEMARRIETGGVPAFREGIETWREIFSFINHSIANHSRDEEEGLFPILRERMGDRIDVLEKDHAWAEETERFLQEEFDALLGADDIEAGNRLPRFAARSIKLARFYRDHIATENNEIFPAAREILTTNQIASLGALMRKHRRIEVEIPEG